ncbi:PAS domain-containing protein, partial [Methanosarcina horonobensis]|uniref:PAS domain-containing protein n=1 Tax=Methanosarcina horonobensis TaxID=418008 RepID=UPI000B2211E3
MSTESKKSNGNTVFVQEQAHPVKDDKGNIAYFDGVFLDLTLQVNRQEESQRAIVNSIPKPSLAYLVDSSRKIKFINDYFVEICNQKSANELIGLTPSDIVESSTLVHGTGKTKSVAETVLDTGQGVYNIDGFIKLRGADRAIYVITSATPIRDDTDSIIGSLMVMTDMTEMKDKEKEVEDLLNYTNTCLKDLGEGIRRIGEGDLEAHLE